MMTAYAERVEQLRWKKFPVLDDGFVCLVDIMGDDQAVVQAARVSYGEGTRAVSDDRTLIRYLMRHRHTTPFEMVELKFLVRVPMDCWRQWIRHRTASVNETSTRYSVAVDAAQQTAPGDWRKQAGRTAKGAKDFSIMRPALNCPQRRRRCSSRPGRFIRNASSGGSREQARKDLPLATYTEAYWKIDLHNLLHFLELRMDAHAQWEIRQYAETMGREIVAPLVAAGLGGVSRLPRGRNAADAAGTSRRRPAGRGGQVPADEAAFLAAGDPAWPGWPAAANATNAGRN